MYYVKTKINDETEITTELTDENVFTRCPECGRELQVDLREIFMDDGDLYSTVMFCNEDCGSRFRSKNH